MRAPDWWESARFQAGFVAWSWFRQNGVLSSRPPAGNAHRWALRQVRKKWFSRLDKIENMFYFLIFASLPFELLLHLAAQLSLPAQLASLQRRLAGSSQSGAIEA